MKEQKNEVKYIIYFSDKLNQRMKQLALFPCTLVVAPMGYGKTTLVSEAMSRMDVNVVWQKIYDKTAADFWAGFYQAVAEIDGECARGLAGIGLLEGRFIKRELMLVLESLHITRNTFLVIDDYHYIKSRAADEFLSLLISHMPENLHIILITRSGLPGAGELQLKGFLNTIGIGDLAFSKTDIEHYFHIQGIRLEEQQLEQLCRYSEGWVSALYLFLLDYRLHGGFVLTSSVPELVYQTVYDPLDNEMKDFLLAICQFDVFSTEQAKTVWRKENTEQLLNRLLSSNAFIMRDKLLGGYSLHNIFRLCIQEQFEKLPEAEQKALWRKTGEAMKESDQLIPAMECFYHSGYFDGVLEVLGTDNPRNLRNEQKELLLRCYGECPVEVKNRHPLSILSFCMDMTTQFREPDWFAQGCRDFESAMEVNHGLTDEERAQLRGEYELILSYHAFNDLFRMRAHHKKAFSLLNSTPRFIYTKNIFTFGAPSVLYLYYRESGRLEELVQLVYTVPGRYADCTGGHGEGYSSVLRAEWMYHRGDYNGAEIAAREGIYLAQVGKQADIELCGLFVMAKLSLCRGELLPLTELTGQMEALARREITEHRTYWLLYTLDLCKGFLSEELGQPDKIADWILEHEYEKNLYFISVAFANMVYEKALLQNGEYIQLLGLTRAFRRQAAIYPNLLALIYTYIYEAAANERLFRSAQAETSLLGALDIALPDGLLLPFVENGRELAPVLERLSGEARYGDFIRKIQKAYVPYRQSVEAIGKAVSSLEIPDLTPRERQIGLLAADGLNNREIAKSLHISPNTVKSEMKSLFVKLGINSRVLLKKELLQ